MTSRVSPPLIVFLFVLALAAPQAVAGEPQFHTVLGSDGRPSAVELRGLPAEKLARLKQAKGWPAVFEVRVASAEADAPAMAGVFEVQGDDAVRFTPRFRLQPGLTYRAQVAPEHESIVGRLHADVTVPAERPAEPTSIAAIYPSAAELPENQLKFYVHFTAPMSRGQAYEHVRLLRENGEAVDLPFLEIGEELWDNSGKRLTLLIDPGRIKQGVKPREDIGPVLEAGQRYTLVIDAAWQDAAGRPLTAGAIKKFSAIAPVSAALDVKTWKLAAPAAGSRQPLRVRFPAPLDHALLQRTIWVESDAGEVEGQITIADQEKTWSFEPAEAWKAGQHWLVVDTVLEDLAGNRIGSAFEVDALDPLQKRIELKTARIPLTIQPAP